jgi:hypothetical protein
MLDATFACPDLTTFTRLDGLGLQVTGQRLAPDRAMLACRVVDADPGDRWCRRCGCEGVSRERRSAASARAVRVAPDHAASDGAPVPVHWLRPRVGGRTPPPPRSRTRSCPDQPDQDLSMRVTHVYRRSGNDWLLVHRHADPLVSALTPDQLSQLSSLLRH